MGQDKNKIALIVAAALAVAGAILLSVWYAGSAAKAGRQLKALQEQAAQIKQKTADAAGFQQEMARRKALYEAFPAKDDAALRQVFDLAKALDVEIVAVEPGTKDVFKDKEGNPIVKGTKKCYVLPVVLKVKAAYGRLVDCLARLDAELSGFVTVEDLTITSDSGDRRQVRMSLRLYMLY